MKVLVSLICLVHLAWGGPTLPPGLPTLPPDLPTLPPDPTLPPGPILPPDLGPLPVPDDPSMEVTVDLTHYGEVRGRRVVLEDPWYYGIETDNFLGIPYGADTGGEARFEWPTRRAPWRPEVHDARAPGPACIQGTGVGMIWMTHPFWFRYSEDCLHLNVHAPTDKSRGPYAVMVWFHGGAYQSGTTPQYPGHFLAANDVVVVVVSYRMHAAGFLSLEDPNDPGKQYSRAPGNAGMMDQKLALEWVQENIDKFGGDKHRVTIFGQSAGASSSALHMMSPKSQHLFHRVIGQSGAESCFWAVNWPSQDPNMYARQVAENMGCLSDDITQMTTCMKNADWRDLIDARFIDCAPGHYCLGMIPIIDGENGFLPDYPEKIRERGEAWLGDLITGITREDGSLYTLFYIPEAGLNNNGKGLTHDEFHYFLDNRLIEFWRESIPEKLEERVFNALDWFYSHWPHIEDLEGNRQAFNHMVTDAAFGMPADRQGRENSKGNGTTYWFVMGMRFKNTEDLFPEWMGVPHMGELPHMWGFPLLKYNMGVRNNSRIWFDVIEWTCEEDALWAVFIQKLWANFAKTGNPTAEPVHIPKTVDPSEPELYWPEFEDTTSERDKLNYMYFNNTHVAHGDAYRQREYEFSRSYIYDMLDGKLRIRRDVGENKPKKKRIRSDIFERGMEKTLTEVLEKRIGKARFAELMEKAKSMKTWEEYEQLVRPLMGIGQQCPPWPHK